MATPTGFTTRAREEIFNLYVAYQALARRIADLTDEVEALGGASGLYGGGDDFPAQPDDFAFSDMVAAFLAITALVGDPTDEQKDAIIIARR